MVSSLRIILCLGFVCGASHAFARDVKDGLEVELTSEGLGLAADMLREQLAGTLSDLAVPDTQDTLTGGIDVAMSDVHASMTLDSLEIRPTDAGLALDVGMSNVSLSVGSMAVDWGPLATTCTGTRLHIAENGVVHLTGVIDIDVLQEMIELSARDLTFAVGLGDYRATGPEECTGWWGVRDVTRLIASGILKSLWPFVETIVTDRIDAVIPSLAEQLNDQTHISVMFDVKGMDPFPTATAELAAFPSRIDVTEGGIRLVAGFRIRKVETVPELRTSTGLESVAVRLASLGFNPTLLTDAIAEIYPDGTDSFELTREQIPNLNDVLKARSLAGIWPDLAEAPLTGDHLRLFVRFTTPPSLVADEVSQRIVAHIPKVELKFLAPIGGAWVDYYVVELDLDAGVRLGESIGALTLGLTSDYTVGIGGHWADGYTPRTALFEKDLLSVVLSTLIDYAREQGPLANVAVPEMPVGERSVSLVNPHVVAPFVRVDAVYQ